MGREQAEGGLGRKERRGQMRICRKNRQGYFSPESVLDFDCFNLWGY